MVQNSKLHVQNKMPAMHGIFSAFSWLTKDAPSKIDLLLGRTQFTSDITSKFGYSAIFSNLRFIRSKKQFTSDITSKGRI